MVNLKQYNKEKDDIKTQLKLFRLFNSTKKPYSSGHTNLMFLIGDKQESNYKKNLIINITKAKEFVNSVKENENKE